MNRHFDSSGRNSWEGFPKSSFGRIDYFEQIDDEEETYFLGLSVIDALSFQEIMTESQTRQGGEGILGRFLDHKIQRSRYSNGRRTPKVGPDGRKV